VTASQAPDQVPDRVPDRAPDQPPTVRDVEYKGAPLDAARGPGLGCFWVQLGLLVVLVVLTPLTVDWGWPQAVSAALLILTIVLLLFAGQTVIFLLRLVAADRRAEARRQPLRPRSPTVGQIEDEVGAGTAQGNDGAGAPAGDAAVAPAGEAPSTGDPAGGSGQSGVRE